MAIDRTRLDSSIRQLQYSKYENISDHFRIIYKTENDKIYCNPSPLIPLGIKPVLTNPGY